MDKTNEFGLDTKTAKTKKKKKALAGEKMARAAERRMEAEIKEAKKGTFKKK